MNKVFLTLLAISGSALAQPAAQSLTREQWGAPGIEVTHTNDQWIIAGKKRTVILNDADLALEVRAGTTAWKMVASGTNDMLVRRAGKEMHIRLADAHGSQRQRYDTGFKTGIKIMLNDWGRGGEMLGLRLHLTICLEGVDEELVCDVAAEERDTVVRELNWPTALDAREVDYTLLPNGRGNLLPRDWPKEYFPIRKITNGKIDPTDHSVLQSHVIESWSMSWWGFQKGKSAMMVICETPDDAAYQFEHPAGGPTVIGPRWLATLGKFGYLRSARMCFFDDGNYVTMAKRYRRYAQETGLFVSLKEKIARTPGLADLIGVPQTRAGILRNLSKDSDRYDKEHPTNNYSLVTFDERAKQLRALKASGVERTLVFISGWPHLGYDNQHPDPLPPPEVAGGWDGMKRLADTCKELGYPFIFHDQYRDYYADAPSYDPQFAIHEEDDSLPPRAAFGSRFGDWKDEDRIPWMRHWDGGKQTYLNARFQPGHLRKNYALFFEHGIHPQGIYIDVIGYVPPDEDFNSEHPTTRSDAMRGQIELLNWSRHNLGVTATEAGSDWVIPHVDIINQSGGGGKTVPLPLYNLVYHDAVLISYGAARSGGEKNLLLGLLCGGVPELPAGGNVSETTLALIQKMSALHKRVALLEMTNHEFLDLDRKKERTTFADGTTVTVDWNGNSVEIKPDL
ncbi:MAG: hypothetical protein EPO07_17255 [Verrucomicrobia bacterium]|nr:MAG: hypothetical protein EPO07_17255 [Verrucomicrobiota bacterium]